MKNEIESYFLKIDGKYFEKFEEVVTQKGKVYWNEGFKGLGTVYDCSDTIILNENISKAHKIEGRINLKSIISKIIQTKQYQFKKMEILKGE